MDDKLKQLLVELVAAHADRWQHFSRFPRSVADASPACEADWSRCMRRHEKAIEDVTNYAREVLLSTEDRSSVL